MVIKNVFCMDTQWPQLSGDLHSFVLICREHRHGCQTSSKLYVWTILFSVTAYTFLFQVGWDIHNSKCADRDDQFERFWCCNSVSAHVRIEALLGNCPNSTNSRTYVGRCTLDANSRCRLAQPPKWRVLRRKARPQVSTLTHGATLEGRKLGSTEPSLRVVSSWR